MIEVKMYSLAGHDVLYSYEPETANMEEVNRVIDEMEQTIPASATDQTTGLRLDKVTRDTKDVTMVPGHKLEAEF